MGPNQQYFAWLDVREDGSEALIAASLPHGALVPLVNQDYETVRQLRPYAVAHAQATGRPVRLISFIRDQVLEEIAP